MVGWVDRYYIYALIDLRSGEVGYVGYTRCLRCRHRRHVMDAPKARYPVGEWIYSLLKEDTIPHMEVLEETSDEGWDEAERRWIADLLAAGEPLTNVSPGGKLSGGHWRNAECLEG